MSYLLSIVDPDIALWLNVYPTHLSQFALGLSARERAIPEREKADLIVRKMAEEDGKIITASHGHTALYCLDNQPIVDELARHAVTLGTKKVQTFGTHPNATISYGPYSVTTTGTVFEFTLDKKNLSLTLPGFVVPEAYREVCAAAILTARAVGVEPDSAIRNLMNNFTLPPGRSTVLQGINGSTIIDSTYNASPEAMRTFLHLLTTLDPTHARPRVFLCGDMRELGEHSAREHEALATLLPGIADYVYGVGTETKQHIITYLERTHASTSFKEVRWFPTAIALGEYLQRTLPNHALILAKGSQNTIFMEEALNIILRTQEDRARLCRQEPYWQTMKKNFFATKTGA